VIKRLVYQWSTYRGLGKWSGRAVARRLGVTHTYIQKLLRQFHADPGEMLSMLSEYGVADFGDLNRAREHSRRMKERGELRRPRRWKWAEFKVGDQVVRWVAPTKAAEQASTGRTSALLEESMREESMQFEHGRTENNVFLYPSPISRRRRWRPGVPYWR
jgi:transcriptional regulator with XRE-family HTH domain